MQHGTNVNMPNKGGGWMDQRLSEAFAHQARACEALGSPFTALLMQVIAQVWPDKTRLSRQVAGWPGDIGPSAASLPLRIAGGLHDLVLTQADMGLMQVYPPQSAEPADLAQAVGAALHTHDDRLCDWVRTTPQTNEVGRSAVLLAAAPALAAHFGLPIILSELGASAGLNLWFDRYALMVPGGQIGTVESRVCLSPDWRSLAPAPGLFTISARRGVDLNPLDPQRDGLRLMAFVWPDQHARLARLRAALAQAEAGCVDMGDAADWLEARLARGWDGALHLVYHTIAHQYFPAETQTRIAAAMERAGAKATKAAPLAWMGMEADGQGEGASLTLRLWPGDVGITLGRAGFHGQWLDWRGFGG